MRCLFLTVIALFLTCVPTVAQDWQYQDFDARQINLTEKRVVQAALAFAGDYVGLLDGDWGKGSQSALERYTLRTAGIVKPRFIDLQVLMTDFEIERRTMGWSMFYFESTNTAYAFPANFLEKSEKTDVIEFNSLDGRFSLVVDFANLSGALAVHRFFIRKATGATEPYQSLKDNRLITSVSLPGPLMAYVRSDRISNGYVTFSIIAAPEHRTRLALMAASMQRGRAAELTLPPGSLMAALGSPHVEKPPPAVAASPSEAAPRGSGTGFFVNNTDVVTAAHVVEGCGRLSLANGSALRVISQNDALDLAVMTSDLRSADWLAISPVATPQLGAPVMALGYPYLGLLQQGLSVTGGNISALPNPGSAPGKIMVSAPVQPGNSGGPLLDEAGMVVGVVVSRLDDMAILDETGTLPQNMNFAVTAANLTNFLIDAHVMFPVTTIDRMDLTNGIPDGIARSVVPVFCYK